VRHEYVRSVFRAVSIPVALAALALGAAQPVLAADWVWPVDGRVVTPYDYGGDPFVAGQHRGIDIGARVGTSVRAAVGGTVRFAGSIGSAGSTVAVRTADARFDTSYLHLASIAVEAGQQVAAGQPIGTAGRTGRPSSAAPHVHFGVRIAGSERAYRDPLALLPPPSGPRLGPAPRPSPVPVSPPPIRFAPRSPASAAGHGALDLGWALACLALIALAAMLGRSSIGASCRTTSQRRSTTSTVSPTWATSTRR
jgi:murein DD-endopeptidase MepM/ murein hydrolase activator NlpD